MMARSYAMTELYRQLPERPVRQRHSQLSSPMKTVAFTGHRPEKLPWGYDEGSSEALLYKFRLHHVMNVRFIGYGSNGSVATRENTEEHGKMR